MTRGINRKIHVIDASGQILGRLATRIANLLNGKLKPDYAPNVDGGDIVNVKNASQVKVTGKKLKQEEFLHHTTHPGGLKRRPLGVMLKTNPAEVIRLTVMKMLPKNKLRDQKLKRLKVEA